nr:hypothetical protein CFP56_74646 [Quercus suber]
MTNAIESLIISPCLTSSSSSLGVEVIVEVFNRVTLENAHAASETSTRATGNGGRGSGCQGRGCHGGCRASRVHTPKLEHANEDEDELVIEELKDEGAYDTYVDGVGTP